MSLQLVFALAWAGVPSRARPAHYATTHTHTGRLEVNVALPLALIRADGRMMSHNPHPPGDAQRSLRDWTALQDLLNHRFGWADPLDPARRRLVVLPDLVRKRTAEMRRAGIEPGADPRTALAEDL